MYTLSQRRSAADLEPLCSKQQACRQQIKVSCQDKTPPISQNMTRGGKDQLLEGSVPIQVLICPSIRLFLSLTHTQTQTRTHTRAHTTHCSLPLLLPAHQLRGSIGSLDAAAPAVRDGNRGKRGGIGALLRSHSIPLSLSPYTHTRTPSRAHTHTHTHTHTHAHTHTNTGSCIAAGRIIADTGADLPPPYFSLSLLLSLSLSPRQCARTLLF
jgi:hypothetical protein